MVEDKYPHIFQQQNLLTVLCHDDINGRVIANTVNPDYFEGDYRIIAERAVEYWKKHKQAPGKAHTQDILAEYLDPKHPRRETYRRIMYQMLETFPGLNAKYVVNTAFEFMDEQRMGAALLQSIEKYQASRKSVHEIRELLHEVVHLKEAGFTPGTMLSEFDKVLDHVQNHSQEFKTCIPQLNDGHIVPCRKEVLLFLASANKGKSWWLIDTSRRAVSMGKKVCYISLELSEEEIIIRHMQNLFSAAKWQGEETYTSHIKFDGDNLKGWEPTRVLPTFYLDSEHVRDELRGRIDDMGVLADHLMVKQFSTGTLTMPMLHSYLDNLEIHNRFIPDMIVLDYIGLTRTNPDRQRIDLGRNLIEFRGLCIERNVAGVVAHQVSKEGERSNNVRSAHIAEDWSMIGTADNVITYSQTEPEKGYSLARLYVSKARTERSGYGVLIAQAYTTGQFCIQSWLLDTKQYDRVLDEEQKKLKPPDNVVQFRNKAVNDDDDDE